MGPDGFCLSPRPFALALEPLAISIRANPLIVGIQHIIFESTTAQIVGGLTRLFGHDWRTESDDNQMEAPHYVFDWAC